MKEKTLKFCLKNEILVIPRNRLTFVQHLSGVLLYFLGVFWCYLVPNNGAIPKLARQRSFKLFNNKQEKHSKKHAFL